MRISDWSSDVCSSDLEGNDDGFGGLVTLWQRDLYLDGGWRVNNGLGVLNTPAPPLQRNQYRFFLPTVAFAGTSSEWINDDRKLLLQGAFGRDRKSTRLNSSH